MARRLVPALGFLTAILTAVVVAQTISLRQTQRELDQVKSKVERLETREKDAVDRAAAKVEKIEEQVARFEKLAAAKPVAPAPDPGKREGLPTLVTEEDISKIADERIDAKLQARDEKRKAFQGERKMPLHDMAKELSLDPTTQNKVAGIVNGIKRELFDMARTPRPDGTSLVDDLVEAMTSGEPERAQKTFAKIFTENLPGTQTTYLTAMVTIQEKGRQQLREALGPELYTRYEHMGVTPDHIETGFDPMAEYYKQKTGAK
jgi:hypothetical protein